MARKLFDHPKGSYYIIGTVMWEFFSYYGMRSLLVLYLTQKLLFLDARAFNLYGAYTSMVYVTPILGAYIADKFLGYKWSTIMGAIFIALGHFTLAIEWHNFIYYGLGLLVMGVGLFKANSISLLGEFYQKDESGRASAFSLYYVGGNLGAFLAPIVCAIFAKAYGWRYGFIAAGVGMALGLITMFLGFKEFKDKGDPHFEDHHVKPFIWLFPIGFIVCLVLVILIIKKLVAGWVLLGITILSIGYMVFIHLKMAKDTRKELYLFYVLTFLGLAFWVFDQQGGSSITLFIQRNINRMITFGEGFEFSYVTIPTAMFQSVNPLIILVTGPMVAALWRAFAKKNIYPLSITKVFFALLFLTFGFFIIAIAAKLASIYGIASMWWVIVGLSFIAFAELFMDPTVLAFANKIAPKKSASMFTAFYYLFSGSIANYLAARFAHLTDVKMAAHKVSLMTYGSRYLQAYEKAVIIGLILIAIAIASRIIFRRLAVK